MTETHTKGRKKSGYITSETVSVQKEKGRGCRYAQSTETWNVTLNLILQHRFLFDFAELSILPVLKTGLLLNYQPGKNQRSNISLTDLLLSVGLRQKVHDHRRKKTRVNTILSIVIRKCHKRYTSFCPNHPIFNPFQFTEIEESVSVSAGIWITHYLPARLWSLPIHIINTLFTE